MLSIAEWTDRASALFSPMKLTSSASFSPSIRIALYKLTVGEDVRQAFLQWERFPLSEEAEHFLESLSAYVELPSIADGCWKMVDRNQGTSAYTNVSLCVYDEATGAAYLLTMDI